MQSASGLHKFAKSAHIQQHASTGCSRQLPNACIVCYVIVWDAGKIVFAVCSHRMEANPHGCALSAMLLYETVADELMTVLLPINTMRNYALVAARTRLVAMIDVDLLISSMLFDWLKDIKK